MESERTVWAEDTGLAECQIESLTEIAEEATRRGIDVHLDPRDVSEWALELELAGAEDLAERVREIYAERA